MEKLLEKLEGFIEYDFFDTSKKPATIHISMEEFEKVVQEVEKEHNNGWIPASKENNPKKDGFYIATLDGEIAGEEKPFTSLAEFKEGKWVDDEDDYQCVLAWQPKPEAFQPIEEGDRFTDEELIDFLEEVRGEADIEDSPLIDAIIAKISN